MIGLLGVVLAAGGLASYFVVATRLALWRRVPWEFIAITAAGALLGAFGFLSQPSLGAAAAVLASLAILAFSLWYFLVYSMFGQREERPGIGDAFPDSLKDSTGGTFRLADERGKRVVLLFYRGDW
jgi:hypothetical protein